MSVVIELKVRQTVAHSPENRRTSFIEISPRKSSDSRPNLYNPPRIDSGANSSLAKLLIADCSGSVQVALLSGLQPSFHSIQISSQTQTCLHTSLLSLLRSVQLILFTSSSSGPVKKPKTFKPDLELRPYQKVFKYLPLWFTVSAIFSSFLRNSPFHFPLSTSPTAAHGASC